MKHFSTVIVFAGFWALSGCLSFSEETTSPAATPDVLLKIDNKMAALEQKIQDKDKDILLLQQELLANKRRVFELSKSLEGHSMRLRSGFSFSEDEVAQLKALSQPKSSVLTPSPEGQVSTSKSLVEEKTEERPPSSQIVDLAEQKMKEGAVGEAVVMLSELQKHEPGLQDNGRHLILLARAWVDLNEPQNALPQLRRFYGTFPNSTFRTEGKLVEAKAQEKMGATQLSMGLYREVLALAPRSSEAEEARAALSRLREEF
jgi:hypothetical protein